MQGGNDLLRRCWRVALSSYVTNGITCGLGLLFVSLLVHAVAGPLAAAAATVGVIVATPPDQPAPKRGKLTHMLPTAVVGAPLFLVVQLLHDKPVPLFVMLVTCTFLAFLGAAWGKRGLPIAIAVMLAMVFSLAAQPAPDVDTAFVQTVAFAIGAFLYLLWGTVVNSLLNRRYRALVLVDTLFAVADLMRTHGEDFASADGGEAHAARTGRLMRQQAALADQLQSARNILLESPRTPRRLQLAGMLMQVLDMRDHLLACALDLETLRKDPDAGPVLHVLSVELDTLASEVQAIADALLFARVPPPFTRMRPELPPLPEAESSATLQLISHALANRIGYLHGEVQRLHALLRGEAEPDVAVVRMAWQLFVSPTSWSLRPFLALWRWDAPPLRHAMRAALAIGAGQAVSFVLPWHTHSYWILLTIVVVLRGSLAQTLERRNNRVAGTLIGSVLAGALLYGGAPANALLLIVTLGQGVAHAFAIRRYFITAVAATVLALTQAHLLNTGGSPAFATAERIADTLIGVAIAWIFSYVLPSWERTQIPALVARVLAAQTRHAQLALALGQLESVDDKAELDWRLARREAYDSLSALVQAVQRALSEPRAVRPRLDELERMLGHSYQLLAQLTAIKTMLLQRRDRLDIAGLRGPLQTGAEVIEAALAGKTVQSPAAARDDMQTMMSLPDPFEHDLTPWLLRRVHLAIALAQDLKAEAMKALETAPSADQDLRAASSRSA